MMPTTTTSSEPADDDPPPLETKAEKPSNMRVGKRQLGVERLEEDLEARQHEAGQDDDRRRSP